MLYAYRERHRAVIEFVVYSIGYRAIVEKRGVHFVHGPELMSLAAHIEKCFLLARKGSLGQVFGRRRGTYRNREFLRIARALHGAPRFESLGLQSFGKRSCKHPTANLRSDHRKPLHIVDVQAHEHLAYALVQPALRQEIPIGM